VVAVSFARVLAHPSFERGVYDIDFVSDHLAQLLAEPGSTPESRLLLAAAAATASHLRAEGKERPIEARPSGLSPWVSAQRNTLK